MKSKSEDNGSWQGESELLCLNVEDLVSKAVNLLSHELQVKLLMLFVNILNHLSVLNIPFTTPIFLCGSHYIYLV